MSIDTIELWHKRARPKPDERDFNVQFGCHLEEIAEMMAAVVFHKSDGGCEVGTDTVLYEALIAVSFALKRGSAFVTVPDRREFLDALADQIVTTVGVGYCSRMDMEEAVKRVNRSNWSKFGDNGQPIRDENGKITKGPNYKPPALDGCY